MVRGFVTFYLWLAESIQIKLLAAAWGHHRPRVAGRIPASFTRTMNRFHRLVASGAILCAGLLVSTYAAGPTGSGTSSDSTSAPPMAALKLQPVEVLGSHIHSMAMEDVSPVIDLSSQYIDASGFLDTATLLNSMSQIYSGAGAGRGSVPNAANPASGTTAFAFDFTTYAPDVGQTGVSGVSLSGLGGGDTLVLIDGRRAPLSSIGNKSSDTNASFFDISTIPLGMIDHIEILPAGASAIYGADAVAGVINIVLKKNYRGSELRAAYQTSQHGGGTQYSVTLNSGFARGRLSGMVMLDYHRDLGLKASQRPFSATADHTAQGGSDLRLTYGYPATVSGTSSGFFGQQPLNGLTDSGGNPVYSAYVPVNQPGTNLKPTDFIPVGTFYPYQNNLRKFDPAPYLSIITPSKSRDLSFSLDYAYSPTVHLYSRGFFGRKETFYTTTPPTSSPGGGFGFGSAPIITVPASDPDNPFGQTVNIGMTHVDFGPRRQSTRTDSSSLLVGAQGRIGLAWNWDTAVSYAVQQFHQYQTSLDIALLNASFANSDPAQRFNPFVGGPSATNAALYPSFTHIDTVLGFSGLMVATASLDGHFLQLPGGQMGLAVGAEYDQSSQHSTTSTQLFYNQQQSTAETRDTYSVYGELSVPVFGEANRAPLFQRLDLHLAGRFDDTSPFSQTTPQAGLVWQPVKALLLRGSYSQGFRAPSLTEYNQANTTYQAYITDPQRGGTSYYVDALQGANPDVKPEKSDIYNLGVVIDPPFIEGLSLRADYSTTRQKDIIQVPGAQDVIDNEAVFPDRVTRGPVPGGDPYGVGPITQVDIRLSNFGTIKSSYIGYSLLYDVPWHRWGRFTLQASATRTLTFDYELTPGHPYVSQLGDTGAPPAWKGAGSLMWSKDNWTASLFAYYIGSFLTNNSGNALDYVLSRVPSFTTLDVHVGYAFKRGIYRGLGKGLRLSVGIGNLADRYPPFSNSIFGYNGGLHSPLGRTYEMSVALPF